MEENKKTVSTIIKRNKLTIVIIIFILSIVSIILSYIFLKPNTLIGIDGLKQLRSFLLLFWGPYGLICVLIFSVFTIYKMSYLSGKTSDGKNVIILLISLFLIMNFLDQYQSRFPYFNSNIGNDNFFGIDYFDDMKSLFKCELDIMTQNTYTINCDSFYIIDKSTGIRGKRSHPGRNYVEYEVNFTSVDLTSKKSNTIEKAYISYEDIDYLEELLNSEDNSGFTVTIYKNTKLIKNIILN